MSWTKRLIPIIAISALALVMQPSNANAQRGHGGRGGGGGPVVVARYNTFYAPYYSPFYSPFFWGHYAWGYPGPFPPAWYGAPYTGDSGARIQVTPRETEVYVDGYHAGIVDDFDGFSQRLRVPPGEHTIELYLDGYRPVTQNILFQPGDTYKLRHTMEPLPAGEVMPARPAPKGAAPQGPAPQSGVIYDAFGRPSPTPASLAPPVPAQVASVLAIRVQPPDATVLVDGETWQGSGGERLELQVTAGAHRIEVRKDGYLPFSTTVQTAAGQTTPVNVSLTKGGQ